MTKEIKTNNRLTNPVLRKDDAVSRIDGDMRETDIHNHRGGRPTGKDVCLVPTDNVSALVSPTSESDAEGNDQKCGVSQRPAIKLCKCTHPISNHAYDKYECYKTIRKGKAVFKCVCEQVKYD